MTGSLSRAAVPAAATSPALTRNHPPTFSSNAIKAEDEVFIYITNLNIKEGVEIILGSTRTAAAQKPHSNSKIGDRIASLFGVVKRDAAGLVGVSESTLGRATRPSADVIDRSYALSRTFAEVNAVLGTEGARQWFGTPNNALNGQRPRDLIRTRAGERQVELVIQALQDGSFL